MTTDRDDIDLDDAQDGDEAEPESPRDLARRERRLAGERSGKAAHTLMELPEALLGRLGLEEELREVVDGARAITSHGARRREERRLAGVLRTGDLEDVERRLASVAEAGQANAHQFQLAERWRARLIEEGAAGADAFCLSSPGADRAELGRLVEAAQRERATGKPRGAARALFRQVIAALAAPARRQSGGD